MCEAHQHGTEGAATETTHDQGAHGHGHHTASTEGVDTAECPVMKGNHVSKADAEAQGLVREYNGETHYLCCAACGPLFDADPEKYLAAA